LYWLIFGAKASVSLKKHGATGFHFSIN